MRLPIHALDPTGGTPGQVPTISADGSRVEWVEGGGGGGAEVLMVDGATPPEQLTTEAGDDWLYEG